MGLDMYLNRVTALPYRDEEAPPIKLGASLTKFGIKPERVKYVHERVAYWRKANQIHRWFVENVQEGEDDCKSYEVGIDKLKELHGLVKLALQHCVLKEGVIHNGDTLENGKWTPNLQPGKIVANAEAVAEILPTVGGFFFGSTNYDEWYVQDLEDTDKMLTEIIAEHEALEAKDDHAWRWYEYHSSW